MDIHELKQKIHAVEVHLAKEPFVEVFVFERDGRMLHLCVTDRLRKKCRKGGVWKSPAFLTTLRNARYGFNEASARSKGGRDGVFVLDRHYTPKNTMMRKIFNQYLDKYASGVEQVAKAIGTAEGELRAVRLASHHMRLLGILACHCDEDWVVLVDYDDSK